MNILGIIANVFGIGKEYLSNRAKTKQLKLEQEHAIIQAETSAVVDRIMSNTKADNEIDLITARNKRYTAKDDIITYLVLVPLLVAAINPFIFALVSGEWINLMEHTKESYSSLESLPEWYKYALMLVFVDTLGFRSLFRKIADRIIDKKIK